MGTMDAAPPRLLFATDFSPCAKAAERYAVSLARAWGATLTVMTVLEFPPGLNPHYPINRIYLGELMKQATKELAALKARLAASGVAVQTRIADGIPSQEVSAAAKAEDTDLIVVGTRGKTGLEHVVLGSTAERIIRVSPCPVLAVRAETPATTEETGVRLERVLVPMDFSDCSIEAVEYAALVGHRAAATLTLVHVLEPVSYGLDFTLIQSAKREQQREAVTARLAALVRALTSAGVAADHQVRGGLPTDSILEAARALPADLIVMGTHGRRGLSRACCGSVAESVLRKSSCPVLTVRGSKFHAGHRRVVSPEAVSWKTS